MTTTPTTPVIPLVPQLTLKQRFQADGTVASKYIGVAGTALIAAAGSMGTLATIPKGWVAVAGLTGIIFVALSNLSVDLLKLAQSGVTFSAIVSTIPNAIKQYNVIKKDATQLENTSLEPVTESNVEAVLSDAPSIVTTVETAIKQ